MLSRRGTLGLAVAALLSSAAWADFEDGLAAYRAGEHGAAHDSWMECALAGQDRCQFALGTLFDDGLGVPRDSRAAHAWFERAARQDNPDAMMQLGFLHATGRDDFPQDPVRAWAWFARAAGQGVPGAATGRDRVGELLTDDELTAARQLADQLSVRYREQQR